MGNDESRHVHHGKESLVPLAIAGTGIGLIGILVIILIVVLILSIARRA